MAITTKKLIALLLLVAGPVQATKIVSQQLGNWGDTASWVGGVIPGVGDEVSLFHVISATDTRTIGVSLSSGSFAVHLNSTGSIHITSTGKLFQRGYGTYTSGSSNNTDAMTVDGGGDWAFDASASTSPTTLHYGMYPSGSAGYRKIKISGSAGAYATVYNVNPSTVASLVQNGQADGGKFELLYSSAVRIQFTLAYNNALGSQVSWDVQHSSFTNCDLINASVGGNIYSSGTFRHEYNYHQGSVGTAVFNLSMTSKKDALGTRSIKGNIFDITMTVNSSLGLGDFTVRDNFMGAGYSAGASSYSLMTNNFIRMNNANANMGWDGTVSDEYIWWDDDQQNAHVFSTNISSSMAMTGMVWGQSGRAKAAGGDDSGEFWLQGGPGLISTATITNSIFLLNGAGYQGIQITSLLGDANPNKYLNNRFVCDHNTYGAGWDNSSSMLPPFGPVQYDESANMAPDTLSSFRDNLLWRPAISTQPAQFFKVYDSGNAASNQSVGYQIGPTTDVCNPSNCDYNAAYPTALSTGTAGNTFRYLNQGKGYGGNWSTTPGVHDISGQDPQFVDWVRNVELFDSKYWRPYYGLSQPAAWSSGATYNQGDIVSASSSTYYWGASINYVYIDTGSCAGLNPQPGGIPVRSWNTCWKYQSIQDIKAAIISSTTFTDATIGAVNDNVNQTLLKWVRAGYSPTNTAYHNTAHDGADIGAVAWSLAASTFPHITGAWVTTSEKTARQDLWPKGTCSTCAITTNWNGNRAYIFGGKGENVHAITYLQNNAGLDATNVNIMISSFTDNLGHFIIPVTVSSGSVWDSNLSGPVNLFYYRYLQMQGLTQENYDVTEIDARYMPPRFQVPCTGTTPCSPTSATQLWTNRQDHDKFYPDIAVPYELIAPSSFTVYASSSQAIGLDVYIDTNTFIPSGASFNTFYATMSVYEGASLSTSIPIRLKVYNFTMPTVPRLKVTAAVGPTHISLFHGGSNSFGLGGSSQTTREHYYQYLWRHGIIPVGDAKCSLGPGCTKDYPSNEYVEQLNGTLFTPANGFGNTPRISTGVPFYSLGTYGNWLDTSWSSTTITGGASSFCANLSSWSVNMSAYPGVQTALYLEDEPGSSNLINNVERLANHMTNTCTMPGAFINSFVTSNWVDTKSSATHVNMPCTTQWASFSHLQADWPLAATHYETTGTTQAWMYNGHSPASGSMMDTEESGQSAELFGPSAFKLGVQGEFIWEVVNWDNPNNTPVINDMFKDAKTFGGRIMYSSFSVSGMTALPTCDYTDSQGTQYSVTSNAFVSGVAPARAGWVIMLTTNTAFSGFNPDSPSGTLTEVPGTCANIACTCTGDATISYSSWTKTNYHPIRGHNGFNYSNGDGVLLYPGRNLQDPTNNYNFDGPIGSFRLKMVRNGINMYDYASMAYAVNPTSASAIVNTIVPTILYELQPVLNHGYYHNGRQWSDDPQVWESNRDLLAQLISAPSSSTITSVLTATGTAGISFSYQITADQNPQSYTATGLPTGLSVNVVSGLISGIPLGVGTFNVTLAATNSIGTGPSSTLVITISQIGLPWKIRFR